MPETRYVADCTRCQGLCCVVFPHRVGLGFPEEKAHDCRCRHLTGNGRCAVFPRLEEEGYAVCRPYDCFGAGPVVTARMRDGDDPAPHYHDFRRLARLHLLIEASGRLPGAAAADLRAQLDAVSVRFEQGLTADLDAEIGAVARRHRPAVRQALSLLARPDLDDGDGTGRDA